MEVPLTIESKQVLKLATDSADKLGHQYVDTEHLLLAVLRVESCMAAQLVIARGVKPGPIQEEMAKARAMATPNSERATTALLTLDSFLSGLKGLNLSELLSFFALGAVFIDISGKRWIRKEIEKDFEILFAPYAKKNATHVIESKIAETNETVVTTVLFKNALLASEQRVWLHRMSVVLIAEENDWVILLAQATPVQSA